jgi:hypothetical protein
VRFVTRLLIRRSFLLALSQVSNHMITSDEIQDFVELPYKSQIANIVMETTATTKR